MLEVEAETLMTLQTIWKYTGTLGDASLRNTMAPRVGAYRTAAMVDESNHCVFGSAATHVSDCQDGSQYPAEGSEIVVR